VVSRRGTDGELSALGGARLALVRARDDLYAETSEDVLVPVDPEKPRIHFSAGHQRGDYHAGRRPASGRRPRAGRGLRVSFGFERHVDRAHLPASRIPPGAPPREADASPRVRGTGCIGRGRMRVDPRRGLGLRAR